MAPPPAELASSAPDPPMDPNCSARPPRVEEILSVKERSVAGGRSSESVLVVGTAKLVRLLLLVTTGVSGAAAEEPVEEPRPAGCGITARTSAILAFSSLISLSFLSSTPVSRVTCHLASVSI